MNLLLQTDSYKAGHADLYPSDMTGAYAYFESRGGRYHETVFFGLQYYLDEYLSGALFDLYDINEAEEFWTAHFGRDDYFNADRWRALYAAHKGTLPIRIKAVPEGAVAPTHNVLFTVENTDPEFAWLVGFVETLLMKVWYPTTVATQSHDLKRRLASLRDAYSDDRNGLEFMVHDFGYRGCTSEEQAMLGGAAHLLSFKGTDTVAGIRCLQHSYDNTFDNMYGFSVPASEHSIILSYGPDGEQEAFAHMLDRFPTGIVACVSDTYDIHRAVNQYWGGDLRDNVLRRDGTLVVRPDSGDPQTIVADVLNALKERFGYTVNSKKKMLLDSHVRVIQGDGMDYESIPALYEYIVSLGFAPENLTVGAGGGMLQKVNRDTQRFAYKVSEVTRGGRSIAVSKNPATDATKKSKAGRFCLVSSGLGYVTTPDTEQFRADDVLEMVFENGRVVNWQSANDIIARVNKEV